MHVYMHVAYMHVLIHVLSPLPINSLIYQFKQDFFKRCVCTLSIYSPHPLHELSRFFFKNQNNLIICVQLANVFQSFLDYDHEGLVSCGADGLVIVWKVRAIIYDIFF